MGGIDDYDRFHNRLSGWLFGAALAFLLMAIVSAQLRCLKNRDAADQVTASSGEVHP